MELKLYRYSENGESTMGLLFLNGEFFCYTLEDEHRAEKVSGDTRIPGGITYSLGWQHLETPLTKKYRAKYKWFDKHIHIKQVRGFNSVYIHVGNDDDDTAGCLLVGNMANNNQIMNGKISYSTPAFKRLYQRLKPFLDEDENVTLTIHNEGEFLVDF